MANATQQIECPKCSGSGKILAFSHIDNGRCFTCAGNGTIKARAHKSAATAEREPFTVVGQYEDWSGELVTVISAASGIYIPQYGGRITSGSEAAKCVYKHFGIRCA